MADQTVKIQAESKERVAFDLMLAISSSEVAPKNRDYFLKLYYRCRQVTYGHDPKQLPNDE